MKPAGPFDAHVLKRLTAGPQWSQKFPRLKPVIDRLVRDGYARRHPAPGAKVPLMVSITDEGVARLRDIGS